MNEMNNSPFRVPGEKLNTKQETDSAMRQSWANLFDVDQVENEEEAVRRAVEELVSRAVVQPMFQMMRNDPLKSDLIPKSSGEETFGTMLDAKLANRIVHRSNWPLIDSLTSSLLQHRMSQQPIESNTKQGSHNEQ